MMSVALPQGDLALLETDAARELLGSRELARLAYVAPDGTPRLFPMLFHWNGTELVMSTFAGSRKIDALRARPDVAVTIDTAGPPPVLLQLRGRVEVTDVEGIVPEYAMAQRHYYGDEMAEMGLAQIDRPGLRMARIAFRPAWVGLVDFMTRFPGGATADEFAQRGR